VIEYVCINEVGGSVSYAGMGTEYGIRNLTMTDCDVLRADNGSGAIAVTLFAGESGKIRLRACSNRPGIAT
jgi:hypothetical protein